MLDKIYKDEDKFGGTGDNFNSNITIIGYLRSDNGDQNEQPSTLCDRWQASPQYTVIITYPS